MPIKQVNDLNVMSAARTSVVGSLELPGIEEVDRYRCGFYDTTVLFTPGKNSSFGTRREVRILFGGFTHTVATNRVLSRDMTVGGEGKGDIGLKLEAPGIWNLICWSRTTHLFHLPWVSLVGRV